MSINLSRRDFLGSAAAASLAGSALLSSRALAGQRRAGANDRITVGFIGVGKRSFELLPEFLSHPDLQVVGVCDVDSTRREHGKKLVDEHYAKGSPGTISCATFVDYRELLAMPGLKAVVIATPDHWHTAQVIDACKAGKDIYCEKPLTLKIAEAKVMIDAVRKHDRVFQTGSQQRTEYEGRFRKACEYIRAGRIGDLLTVSVGVGAPSIPCNLGEEKLEPGLDWERWIGPAPMRPYNSTLSPRGIHDHYPKWRDYREFSGGQVTDMGAHHFDIVQWALKADHSGPIQVFPARDKNATQGVKLVYANGVEVFHGGPSGSTFTGTKGVIAVDRGRLDSIPDSILKEPLSEKDERLPAPPNHLQDWVDCIKSRKRCICDVEVGARSVTVCHLVNLAYWRGRPLTWDPQKWEFKDDAEANSWRDYERRHGFELPSI